MIESIDNHSVRVDLLSPQGAALDAGARGFAFTDEMIRRNLWALAMDPGPEIVPSVGYGGGGVVMNAALTSKNGRRNLNTGVEMEARFVGGSGVERFAKSVEVECFDIESIMEFWRIESWDVVKLNIEGSEYEVLGAWPGPIAKQISVSFHEHTGRGIGRAGCDDLVKKLGEWYVPRRHVWDERYCAGPNYWDTLLVRKDLA